MQDLEEGTVILFEMKIETNQVSLTLSLSRCSILTNTRSPFGVQEVCPAARHHGKGVRSVQPQLGTVMVVSTCGVQDLLQDRQYKGYQLVCPHVS